MKNIFNAPTLTTIGSALLASFALLTGCSEAPLPVDQKVFDGLHDKSVQSYALVPYQSPKISYPVIRKTPQENPSPDPDFWAVIKTREATSVVTNNGRTEVMKCSSYQVTPLRETRDGSLTADYVTGRDTITPVSVVPHNGKLNITPQGTSKPGYYSESLKVQLSATYCKPI